MDLGAEKKKIEGNSETEVKNFRNAAQEFFKKSNRIFKPAELIALVNLFLFLLGFITIFIFISIRFFNSPA
ncbi:hypothetical protein UR09_04085 [Candidatus Nitromaritima sp. SCGC AAA799-A02]|nr:hypothetical protein UR09_04085 [Candidatus Nitromaritima sp. SCGC AAA799-A02]